MPHTITFPRVIRIGKFTEVFRVYRTPVCLHWSVLAVAVVILAGAVKYPIVNLVGMTSWLGVLLLHEAGHLIAARRKGCEVDSIQLYPILGLVRFQQPWSQWDECLIAWAGVLAQSVVALPIVIFVAVWGYTRVELLNEALAIWGFFSLGTAIFNLIPAPPLDGYLAWRIVPLAIRKILRRDRKRFDVLRSGR